MKKKQEYVTVNAERTFISDNNSNNKVFPVINDSNWQLKVVTIITVIRCFLTKVLAIMCNQTKGDCRNVVVPNNRRSNTVLLTIVQVSATRCYLTVVAAGCRFVWCKIRALAVDVNISSQFAHSFRLWHFFIILEIRLIMCQKQSKYLDLLSKIFLQFISMHQ